jgi:hypothetical protein
VYTIRLAQGEKRPCRARISAVYFWSRLRRPAKEKVADAAMQATGTVKDMLFLIVMAMVIHRTPPAPKMRSLDSVNDRPLYFVSLNYLDNSNLRSCYPQSTP